MLLIEFLAIGLLAGYLAGFLKRGVDGFISPILKISSKGPPGKYTIATVESIELIGTVEISFVIILKKIEFTD